MLKYIVITTKWYVTFHNKYFIKNIFYIRIGSKEESYEQDLQGNLE